MKQIFFFCLLCCSLVASAQPFYLRGSEFTCPWSGNFTAQCELTDADSNGVYELALPLSMGLGAQEFKVYNQTADVWFPGGANAWYEHVGGSLVFKYTPDMSVEVGDGPKSMCAPGAFSGWDNATPMVNEVDNIWCYTIAVPGTYIWKPTACGTWRSFQPSNGERSMDASNWSVTTTQANEKVCVSYNPATGRAIAADAPPPVGCTNPVPAATATASTASLTWSAIPTATSYIVSYRPLGTSGFATKTVTSNAATLTGLYFSTKYQYKVEANCATAGASLKTFTTVNTPICATPYFFPTTTTGTSITVKWRSVFGETGQQLQYRKVGVAAWTSLTIPLADSSKVISGLLPNSAYQFRLRVKCGTTFLPWSAIGKATTLAAALSGDAQNLVAANSDLGVFPNPTSNELTVTFEAAEAQLRLSDVTGRQLMTWDNAINGQKLDIGSLPAGLYYLVAVLPNDEILSQRVIKQ